ncbi:Uncharacterized protein ChrSV_0011 [Chromobacterium vaccinii]|nr:Uncharacterized protein ChrSW_0011 [Chromobacterium vaccinii]QND87470.1 Uncharacterized protein ChrSV_0011 [Chromobacterium vaccinii]
MQLSEQLPTLSRKKPSRNAFLQQRHLLLNSNYEFKIIA